MGCGSSSLKGDFDSGNNAAGYQSRSQSHQKETNRTAVSNHSDSRYAQHGPALLVGSPDEGDKDRRNQTTGQDSRSYPVTSARSQSFGLHQRGRQKSLAEDEEEVRKLMQRTGMTEDELRNWGRKSYAGPKQLENFGHLGVVCTGAGVGRGI